MAEENVIHTSAHNEFYSAIKSETRLFAGKGVEMEDILLSKTNQTQTDNYHIFHYMWK